MHKVYVGGDGGTSGNKTVAVDEEGRVVVEHGPCGSYPIIALHPGWSEQRLAAIYAAETEGLAGIVNALHKAGIGANQIGAIATTMQMHTSAYYDEGFTPVRHNVILWNDARASDEVEEMIREFSLETVIEMVNNHPTTGYSVFHAKWLQEHEPEIWAQVRRISLLNSCFGRWTTGAEALNSNDAAGTCAYDVANGCWSETVADWSGVPIEFWPKVMFPNSIIGYTLGIEAATGIPDGIPVIAGLGDCAAGALGCGVTRPGRICGILGTAGIFVAPTDTLVRDVEGGGRVQSYNYVSGRYHTLTTNLSAGAMLEGLAQLMGRPLEELDCLAGIEHFETSTPLVDSRLCGERTGAPGWKPNARGAILSLGLDSMDPGRIWLAALKAIVFNQMLHFRIQLDLGVPADEIILMGGGTKSPFYTDILVAGLTATKPGVVCRKLASGQGGGARGMAILAGHGAGYISDLDEVAGNLEYGAEIEPNPSWVKIMKDQFTEWRACCYDLQ